MWRAMISQYWWPNLILKYEKSHYMSKYVLPYVENNLLITAHSVLMSWPLATRVCVGSVKCKCESQIRLMKWFHNLYISHNSISAAHN